MPFFSKPLASKSNPKKFSKKAATPLRLFLWSSILFLGSLPVSLGRLYEVSDLSASRFNLDRQDYRKLYKACERAVAIALRDPSRHEPELVANLVYQLPLALNGIQFNSVGISKIQSGGVFVHKQPLVESFSFDPTISKSIEIGDLLLIRSEKVSGTVSNRSALLLQAKKTNKLPGVPDNKNQHLLYSEWPEFTYVRSTQVLNGEKRQVEGNDIYNGAKYLLISEQGNLQFHHQNYYDPFLPFASRVKAVTAQPIAPVLSHYNSFVSELIDFVLGDAGKPYTSPVPVSDIGWDKTIDDLIQVTAKQKSVSMANAAGNLTKNGSRGVFCLSGEFSDPLSVFYDESDSTQGKHLHSLPPINVPPEWDVDEKLDSEGISTVEFIIETEAQL